MKFILFVNENPVHSNTNTLNKNKTNFDFSTICKRKINCTLKHFYFPTEVCYIMNSA